jgi:hypothetical protein
MSLCAWTVVESVRVSRWWSVWLSQVTEWGPEPTSAVSRAAERPEAGRSPDQSITSDQYFFKSPYTKKNTIFYYNRIRLVLKDEKYVRYISAANPRIRSHPDFKKSVSDPKTGRRYRDPDYNRRALAIILYMCI